MMMMMESNKCRQTLSSPLNNVGHNVCVVALLLVGCALINASPAGRPTSAALPLPTSAPDVQSSTTSTTSASATTVASKNSIINDNYFEFSSDDDASATRNADATIDDDDAANNANYDDPAPKPSPCQLDCFATVSKHKTHARAVKSRTRHTKQKPLAHRTSVQILVILLR